MTVDISIPRLLAKAAPILKYGSIAVLIFYVIFGAVAGLVYGLVVAALCWIIAFLCDAVVELYAEVEKLRVGDIPPQTNN